MTIGSETWRIQAESQWHRLHLSEFDAVKAFRSATLREISAHKPRSWRGVLPWKLHEYDDPSCLDRRFVAYLDVHLALYDWHQRMWILTHQPSDWWASRLSELDS
jgi:hypothetical protein